MDVRSELHRDHADHELELERLTCAVEARQSATALLRGWQAFEENLVDHLDAEERHLFTVTVQAHRKEIEQLRAEHRGIREALIALSAAVQRNSLDKGAIDEFRALLRAHSAHEEQTLHRWLEIDEGFLALRGVLAIRDRRERALARVRPQSND